MIKDGATRDGYGTALVELGHNDSNVVVLDAGVSDSTRTIKSVSYTHLTLPTKA